MTTSDLPPPIASLVESLAALPGVVAVTRHRTGQGEDESPDSQWDLGLYYRGELDPEPVADLPGFVRKPHGQGGIETHEDTRTVEGFEVKVRYRNVDEVSHWINEARDGRFQVDEVSGHLAGFPTYALAAEVALDEVLAGSLDLAIAYPDRLAREGAAHWRHHAESSLNHAHTQAERGNLEGVMGHLARASFAVAHARLCEARTWTRNEKEILKRAEVSHINQILAALNTDPVTLTQRVMQARTLLFD